MNDERLISNMPRVFKVSAGLLRSALAGESIHNLIYNVKYGNIKAMYALVCNALRNESLLNEMLNKSGLDKEGINKEIAKILVTELLWGKKAITTRNNKTIELVESYLPKLIKAQKQSSLSESLQKEAKPRYARINTLLTSVQRAIQSLKGDGWCLVTTPTSFKKFRNRVVQLGEKEFMRDFHFEDLLVFSPEANLFGHQMVKDSLLLLQDKASFLSPVLLSPPPGSTVLDMCAAPGMKALHLAGLMENQGCLYAVDVHKNRFEILQKKLEAACPEESCVSPLLKDSLTLTAEDCPGVKFILLDPSCSGVGMSKRIEDRDSSSVCPKRLRALQAFQVKLLTHALTAFPDVERVVYSTCSEYEEENEHVIKAVLAKVPEFQVVPPSGVNWERRGNSQFEFGSNCLVASRKKDLTNGFFVAVLERVCEKVPVTDLGTTEETKPKASKKRKSDTPSTSENTEKKKKKKKSEK